MTSNAGTVAPGAAIDLATAAAVPPEEVLQRLGSRDSGLSDTEAADRLRQYGPNIVGVHRVRAIAVLWGQLRNPLLLLLLVAAAVSGLTGDPTDATIIAVIAALSVGLGFVNEYRAAVAVEQLHDRIRRQAVVWRDGRQLNVDVTQLVPGDVAALRIGDIVPADIRLLEADQLETDESVLTGESLPVSKDIAAITGGAEAADLSSCVFMGTIVQQGSGRGVVVGTGAATAFGKIASGLADRPPETGFQVGLREFSKLLAAIALVVAALVFIINVVLGRPPLQALLFSLAIAVGLTPELFPAIVSVSLSAGSRALAKRHVLVKRLVAIEDLGNIQVLFTDKTGTLTEGAITFNRAVGPDGQDAAEPFRLGLLCNEASMTDAGPVGGNPLDQALLKAAAAGPLSAPEEGLAAYHRLGILPFDHRRQMCSVLVARPDRPPMLITKGAPEAVFARCSALPQGAQATLDKLFADGERVVAVATRDLPP